MRRYVIVKLFGAVKARQEMIEIGIISRLYSLLRAATLCSPAVIQFEDLLWPACMQYVDQLMGPSGPRIQRIL